MNKYCEKSNMDIGKGWIRPLGNAVEVKVHWKVVKYRSSFWKIETEIRVVLFVRRSTASYQKAHMIWL
jgi:hypothetical protein